MNKAVRHIAFIMDGNRRYAKEKGLHAFRGHEEGYKTVDNVCRWCRELGIKEVTLFAFSLQNFARTPEEVEKLLGLFREAAKKIESNKEKNKEENVRIVFIGRLDMFPADVQEAMQKAMDSTKDNTGFRINIAMAYGGREEIVDATKHLAKQVKEGKIQPEDISEEMLTNHLYLSSEPDLIIRTSGEHRTSNFLTWQSNYSEWIFHPKHWPAFTKEDLQDCIKEYENRERRFGK